MRSRIAVPLMVPAGIGRTAQPQKNPCALSAGRRTMIVSASTSCAMDVTENGTKNASSLLFQSCRTEIGFAKSARQENKKWRGVVKEELEPLRVATAVSRFPEFHCSPRPGTGAPHRSSRVRSTAPPQWQDEAVFVCNGWALTRILIPTMAIATSINYISPRGLNAWHSSPFLPCPRPCGPSAQAVSSEFLEMARS